MISTAPPHEQIRPTPTFSYFEKADIEQGVPRRIEQIAARYPDRLAAKSGPQQMLTYAALNLAANRAAHAITAMRGMGQEPVCLLFEHSVSTIVAILAVLKAGKIYVPLDVRHPPARIRHILDDVGTGLIITHSQHLPLVAELAGSNGAGTTLQVLNLDDLDPQLSDENLDLPISPDAYAYILYTSGSTGQPKGVVHTHRNLLHNTRNHTNHEYLCPEDRLMLMVSASSGSALTDIFGALLNGAAVCLFDPQEQGLAQLARWLVDEEITIYHSSATAFRNFAALLTGTESFPKLRIVKSGAETIYKQDAELFKEHFGPDCVFRAGFATTETNSISWYFVHQNTPIAGPTVPVGYPVEGKEVLLWDEAGNPVGKGEIGEIVVRSLYLAAGYWGNPELTQAKFLPDLQGSAARIYLTGDLGRMHPDGLLEHLGRKDFQVKIRGYRVELALVEAALLHLEEVREAAVMAQPDPAGEKRLVAYVVPASNPAPAARELRTRLAEQLPDYMVPPVIVFLDTLPHLPNGKLDRLALPVPGDERPELSGKFLAPRDPWEVYLVQVWQAVLHIRSVGVLDDFFELGGDSLMAARIFAAIEKQYGQKLSPKTLLAAPTVAKLAALVRGGGSAVGAQSSALVALQPQGSRPPFILLHGIGGGILDYTPLARYLGPEQPVYGLPANTGEEMQSEPPLLETMAAHYVHQVLTFQANGPYLLGGYSYGGAVAFEVAQQLQRLGRQVSFLAMIDCAAPTRTYRQVKWNRDFLRRFTANLPYWSAGILRLGPAGIYNRARHKTESLARYCVHLVTGRAMPFQNSLADYVDDFDQIPPEYRWIMEYQSRAKHTYRPQPYSGRVTLFRTRAQPLICSFDPLMGWGALAQGGVDAREVPGSHHDMLQEPFARGLARQMRLCLDEVQSSIRQ